MTEAIRRQLKISDITEKRGVYAKLDNVARQLLINDVVAGRA